MSAPVRISKKKKMIADGVFRAEIHEFFAQMLSQAGYAGLTVKAIASKIKITVKVVNKQDALGQNGIRGNELEALIEKRFGFEGGRIEIAFETVRDKSLCASAQAEFLKAKLLQGAPVRSAAMFIIRSVCRREFVKGCEIVISGKLRQQRAKTMKYRQGYLISTGQPKNDFVDVAIRHIKFKQGMMGVKLKILLPSDMTGKFGIQKLLPDKISIKEPAKKQEEKNVYYPTVESGVPKPAVTA